MLLQLFSCKEQQMMVEQVVNIPVKQATANSTVRHEDFIASIDSLLLRPDSGCYVASVQDVCLSDSCVAILDVAKSIFIFNLNTGKQVALLNNTGHGKGEYVDPKSIMMHNGLLYVLDFKTSRILKYDDEFKYCGDVRIGFPACDFSIVDNGFVLYNMNATNDLKRVVHTDFDGNIINSFLVPKETIGIMPTDKVFTEDGFGNVFYIAPQENMIYRLAEDTIDVAFTLGYEDEPEPPQSSGKLKTKFSLISSKYILTQFVADRYVLTNVYNTQTGVSEAGIVSTGTNFPFVPQLSQKDVLFSVVHPFDKTTMREKQDLYLVRYTLK